MGSGSGSFERTHDPDRVQSKGGLPLYSASKAAKSAPTLAPERTRLHFLIGGEAAPTREIRAVVRATLEEMDPRYPAPAWKASDYKIV